MLQLSDGVKKWSVILPTAPLPRPWRIAARERLLARLELAKARPAKLLIIAHPKSGNTWLKVMLSRLYQARHGLPDSLINSSDELARRNPAIPRVSATNGYYSYDGAVGRALAPEAPDSELRHKPVVLLAQRGVRRLGCQRTPHGALVAVVAVGGRNPWDRRISPGQLVRGVDQRVRQAVARLIEPRQHDLEPGVAALGMGDDEQLRALRLGQLELCQQALARRDPPGPGQWRGWQDDGPFLNAVAELKHCSPPAEQAAHP